MFFRLSRPGLTAARSTGGAPTESEQKTLPLHRHCHYPPHPHTLHTFSPISIEAIVEHYPQHLDQSNAEMNLTLPEPLHLSQHSLMKAPCYRINGSCEAIRILKTYKPVWHV